MVARPVAPHRFLLEPGRWEAAGHFRVGPGDEWRVATGVTEVRHEPQGWTIDGLVRVERADGGWEEFRNRYEVVPGDGSDPLRWSSYNPALGRLEGEFHLVGEAIISTFEGAEGELGGCETLVGGGTGYRVFGVLTRSGAVLSSWVLDLKPETTVG